MTAYDRAKGHSEKKLRELRQRLSGVTPTSKVVLTCGSYARREASQNSDLDFFIIDQSSGGSEKGYWLSGIQDIVHDVIGVSPAKDGAFSNIENHDEMLQNIGGENDNNHKITRRMLFLLEGEWLANEEGLREFRKKILQRYIGDPISDHQLALFLLNDIIRYYRTMAVDYEFKTAEGENPKPWGIRNIKLVFSRKLLYTSGLFSVAMTVDRTRDAKIQLLEELFAIPVIERMVAICGSSNFSSVLDSYNKFLCRLEDPDVRDRLERLERSQRDDSFFRELKNEGHHFTRELLKLFENTFDSTHPIRRAVVF